MQTELKFTNRAFMEPPKIKFAASKMPKHTRNPFKASYTRTSKVSNKGNPETILKLEASRNVPRSNQGSRTLRFMNTSKKGNSVGRATSSNGRRPVYQNFSNTISSPTRESIKDKNNAHMVRGQSYEGRPLPGNSI
jgi:hypothetical protein